MISSQVIFLTAGADSIVSIQILKKVWNLEVIRNVLVVSAHSGFRMFCSGAWKMAREAAIKRNREKENVLQESESLAVM
jgi:hypothetical protein